MLGTAAKQSGPSRDHRPRPHIVYEWCLRDDCAGAELFPRNLELNRALSHHIIHRAKPSTCLSSSEDDSWHMYVHTWYLGSLEERFEDTSCVQGRPVDCVPCVH